MKYAFPTIRTIDDVLPHIAGRDEFIVAERPGYVVINYTVAFQETFAMSGPDDLGGAIRRECRGLIFDKSGKIISRPFHKFFNCFEREETFPANINMAILESVEDKLDGTMARPFLISGSVRFGTKMGITDGFSYAIEKQAVAQDEERFVYDQLHEGRTPIYEYTAPTNRIVVGYTEPQLRLLAVRDMVTGQYLRAGRDYVHPHSVGVYQSPVEDLGDFVDHVRKARGIEGYVMVFNDGHRVKLKTEEYVRIHKTKDEIRYDFYIAQHILNEELDDVKPFLDEQDAKRVEEYERCFWNHFCYHMERITPLVMEAANMDRKEVATQLLKDCDGWTKTAVFKALDGNDLRSVLLGIFAKNVNGQTAHQKLMDWK